MARRTIEYAAGGGALVIRHNRLQLKVVVPDYYGRVTVSKLSPTGASLPPYATSEWHKAFGRGEIRNGAYRHKLSLRELKWLYSLEKENAYLRKGVA